MKKLFLILSIYTSIAIAADDDTQQLDLTNISVISCTEIMPLKEMKSDTTNMMDDEIVASIDGLFISQEEKNLELPLKTPVSNAPSIPAQSEKKERVVVLLRDIEFLEWDLVALENQVNEMRACGRIIQTDERRFFTIGEDAHRCFEQSFKTRNTLQKKRELLEELLNNQ